MLAARGVSLGLGKINLSDLHSLPHDRARIGRLRANEPKRPRIIIRKQADKQTVWAACRAVIFGCIVICVGLAMAVLGYFDTHFSTRVEEVDGVNVTVFDPVILYQLKAMQYVGPVLMGAGTFILIIACVITLESRDKHAQVMQLESDGKRKEEREVEKEKALREGDEDSHSRSALLPSAPSEVPSGATRLPPGFKTPTEHSSRRLSGPAPIAVIDSLLDIVSTSSSSSAQRPPQ